MTFAGICLAVVLAYFTTILVGYLFLGEAPLLGHADELLVALLFLVFVSFLIIRKSLPSESAKLLLVSLLLLLWGSFSLWVNPLMSDAPRTSLALTASLIDLKFYILVAILLPLVERDFERVIHLFCIMLVAFALINLLFCFADIVRGVDLRGNRLMTRSGLLVPQGIFDHKYKAAFTALAGWIGGLALEPKFRSRMVFYSLMAILTVGVMLLLSAKEILALVTISIIHLTMRNLTPRRISAGTLAALLLGIILLTDNPIANSIDNRIYTFTQLETVRGALYAKAPTVAADYFPLGAGWGTYGSSATRDIYYSPLYVEYGISNIWGGSRREGMFLTDLFWPKILGELGVIGATLYLYLWFIGLKGAWRIMRSGAESLTARFSLYSAIALFILSLATPIYNYADGSLLTSFSFIGLILAQRGKYYGGRLTSAYRKTQQVRRPLSTSDLQNFT